LRAVCSATTPHSPSAEEHQPLNIRGLLLRDAFQRRDSPLDSGRTG
jgi:hypothetical protein